VLVKEVPAKGLWSWQLVVSGQRLVVSETRPERGFVFWPLITDHWPLSSEGLLQLGVFGLGLFQDGDFGVGVFPEGKEIFVGGEGADAGGIGIGSL